LLPTGICICFEAVAAIIWMMRFQRTCSSGSFPGNLGLIGAVMDIASYEGDSRAKEYGRKWFTPIMPAKWSAVEMHFGFQIQRRGKIKGRAAHAPHRLGKVATGQHRVCTDAAYSQIVILLICSHFYRVKIIASTAG
jgi:hypothetical protein